jgi:flagellar export protein FliJ
MSRKLKVLARVREARQKQRDASAADASVAEAHEHAAERAREDAKDALEALLEQSAVRLASASGAHALLDLESERHTLNRYLEEARRAHEQAVQRGNVARALLREKERSLRTSDKLIEREKTGLERAEQREEQRASDDFVSARFGA